MRSAPDNRARWPGFPQELLVDPEEHLLAFLAAVEHAGFAQDLQVVRHGGAGKRGNFGDLADIQPLAGCEGQQDALAVLVAERGKHPGHVLPGGGMARE
jgi:hypothetical protein